MLIAFEIAVVCVPRQIHPVVSATGNIPFPCCFYVTLFISSLYVLYRLLADIFVLHTTRNEANLILHFAKFVWKIENICVKNPRYSPQAFFGI